MPSTSQPPTTPGIWSQGKPLVRFHMAAGLRQDSVPHAKAGQSSRSNYLKSSVDLDVSLGDCSDNLLLESGAISAAWGPGSFSPTSASLCQWFSRKVR